MKWIRSFGPLLLAILAMTAPGRGQQASGAPPARTPQARPAMPPPTTIAATLDLQVGIYEGLVVGAAEAMPEDKFYFTPASLKIPGSAYTDVRTFAALVKHTAAANYVFWSGILGDKPPANNNGLTGPDELKTKAQIVQYLKDSFAVGHRAAQSLTAASAVEQVPFGSSTTSRLFMAGFGVVHCGDDYGQMVEYLRMNGIVPPASRGR
jgi:hypothetical protein